MVLATTVLPCILVFNCGSQWLNLLNYPEKQKLWYKRGRPLMSKKAFWTSMFLSVQWNDSSLLRPAACCGPWALMTWFTTYGLPSSPWDRMWQQIEKNSYMSYSYTTAWNTNSSKGVCTSLCSQPSVSILTQGLCLGTAAFDTTTANQESCTCGVCSPSE